MDARPVACPLAPQDGNVATRCLPASSPRNRDDELFGRIDACIGHVVSAVAPTTSGPPLDATMAWPPERTWSTDRPCGLAAVEAAHRSRRYGSTESRRPKIWRRVIQPLMPPRLLPI